MNLKKYAAIDIGSNGVRLLISNIIETDGKAPQFNKSSLVRVPIRLGEDVFINEKISYENQERLSNAIEAFKLLMDIYGVENFKACATSAMREAKNGKVVIEKIKKKTGVSIEIIDGKKEAQIISSTDLKEFIEGNKNYLYVDVGGGSTEFTLFSKGKLLDSKSFKLGTVRILDGKVSDETWKEAKQWVKEKTKDYSDISLIGSGGNINKIFKLSGKPKGKSLSRSYLKNYYKFLNEMTYEERMSKLDLNPDRADVIIPALKIYLKAMKWSNAKKIFVPKIGLSDGIIKSLYSGVIN